MYGHFHRSIIARNNVKCLTWTAFLHKEFSVSFLRHDLLKSFLHLVCKNLYKLRAFCACQFFQSLNTCTPFAPCGCKFYHHTLCRCGTDAQSFCNFFTLYFNIFAFFLAEKCLNEERRFPRIAHFFLYFLPLFACWCTELLAVVACLCNKVTPFTTTLILLEQRADCNGRKQPPLLNCTYLNPFSILLH